MLINELRLKNLNSVSSFLSDKSLAPDNKVSPKESPFAKELAKQVDKSDKVQFSKHAIERIDSRGIDINGNNVLERLNRGVELASEKGSNETLIIVDSTAFVVNVKNNKVITTMGKQDMQENVFTNIDSTVIM